MVRFNASRLRSFTIAANKSNIMYFAVRRRLFDLFSDALDSAGAIDLPSQEYITMRTFLTTRSNTPSDDARLAYEVTLLHIQDMLSALNLPALIEGTESDVEA